LASQTSLEIAIRNSHKIVEHFRAKEIWFLRNIPVRMIGNKSKEISCHAFKLIKLFPDRHTYGFSFAL
jgi:hypothetical protein